MPSNDVLDADWRKLRTIAKQAEKPIKLKARPTCQGIQGICLLAGFLPRMDLKTIPTIKPAAKSNPGLG